MRSIAYESRSTQVARHLKELLRSGQWKRRLPSERAMAAQIGVGRDTIRAALSILEKEGLALERSQAGTRLRRMRLPRQGNQSVGILLLMRVEMTTYRTLQWLDEFRRILYQQNIKVELYDGYVRKRGMLSKLLTAARHDCWVLVYPNKKALQWCLENHLRAVVVGTLDDGIPLPSVDIHYRALCRHAAGRLLQLGHRHLALILHKREWGADAKSIQGFLEGAHHYPDITTTIEYHDGTPRGIRMLADRLLTYDPMPTGWIIAVAPHFLTAMMHLLGRGIAIPKQISLISQDAEPWQHFVLPEPARYAADIQMLARQAYCLVQRSIAGKTPILKPVYIMPELLSGTTLAPASK